MEEIHPYIVILIYEFARRAFQGRREVGNFHFML